VWILCQRDLNSCTDSKLERVAWGKEQRRDERRLGEAYRSRDLLGQAKRLLKAFVWRRFSMESITVGAPNRMFSSRYHFLVCTFRM
jgi:hypothetical protein